MVIRSRLWAHGGSKPSMLSCSGSSSDKSKNNNFAIRHKKYKQKNQAFTLYIRTQIWPYTNLILTGVTFFWIRICPSSWYGVRNSVFVEYGIPGRDVNPHHWVVFTQILHVNSKFYLEFEYDHHFDIGVRNSVLSAWGTEIQTESENPRTDTMVTQVLQYTHKILRRIRTWPSFWHRGTQFRAFRLGYENPDGICKSTHLRDADPSFRMYTPNLTFILTCGYGIPNQ